MGPVEVLQSAANATKARFKGDGSQLSEDDVERIADALVARLHLPSGFKTFDFCLGIFVAAALTFLFFNKLRRRLTKRQNESEAVEVLKNLDDEGIKRLFRDSDMPSWVNFPDFERVGWINDVLSQLWPSINSAVSQQFREMLAPLLHQNKPSWIASLKLFRFDLGDTAPQANGVKVYPRSESKGEITIEVDFSWVGKQDVQLTIKPIPKHLGPFTPAGHLLSSIIRLRAGIERIIINGSVRLMWKPLLGELPIIGGMQAALVEMPKFSFDVTIYGGDASLVPGLDQWLTQFMKDNVFRPYILPDRYTHSFLESAEIEDLRPKGILFLKILEARNVPKMDLFSQSDPYVKLSVRHATQLRTGVKQNNANPKWNESFKVLIHHPDTQSLTCVLMDFDDYNPDDEIGRCVLPIRDLQPEETTNFWLDVDIHAEESAVDEKHNRGVFGTILEAEQKVASQGEKLWKRLPGVRQRDKACQLRLETTLYMLDSDDLEEAVRQDQEAGERHKRERERTERGRPPAETNDNAAHARDDHTSEGEAAAAAEREPRSEDEAAPSRESAQTTQQSSRDRSSTDDGQKHESDPSRASDHGASSNGREAEKERERPSLGGGVSSTGAGSQRVSESGSEARHRGSDGKRESSSGGGTPGPTSSVVSRSTSELKDHTDVRSEALDALKGGILFVKPKKAESLKRKPFYKSFFLHSAAQLEVTVCGQRKTTASVSGSNPLFSETLEFLLGGKDLESAEHERLKIEVWDHRLHLHHFRGGCSLVLRDIIDHQRIQNTLRLTGVSSGEISLEVYWVSALDSAKHAHQNPQAKAAQQR